MFIKKEHFIKLDTQRSVDKSMVSLLLPPLLVFLFSREADSCGSTPKPKPGFCSSAVNKLANVLAPVCKHFLFPEIDPTYI